MSQITKELGERLRALRLAAGLTQEKLAERADVHATYVGQLERGEKNATVESVCKLTRALGTDPAALFAHLPGAASQPAPAEEIYQLIQGCTEQEQQELLQLLTAIVKFKRG